MCLLIGKYGENLQNIGGLSVLLWVYPSNVLLLVPWWFCGFLSLSDFDFPLLTLTKGQFCFPAGKSEQITQNMEKFDVFPNMV